MNRDIYKKGLVVLAIIVIVIITALGYIISVKNNEVLLPSSNEENKKLEVTVNDDNANQEIVKEEDKEISKIIVDINGAVKNPGIYELEEGMRVNDVIEAAGGLTDEADTDYVSKNINKARIVSDEEKLYIPKIGDDLSSLEQNNDSGSIYISAVPNGKINLNTATKQQLVTLKGIGDTFAQRIIDYRKDKKFNSIEDIKNVKGIGDKTFEDIKDYITVE